MNLMIDFGNDFEVIKMEENDCDALILERLEMNDLRKCGRIM